VSTASRREVLRAALLGAGAGLLAACGQATPAAPTPAPQPTPRPTEAAARPTEVARPTQALTTANPTQTAPAAGAALVSVKYGNLGIAPEAGVYLALDRGYFREEGLDVQLERFTSGAEQTAPLATGQLHFGAGGPDPSLFNAVGRGIQLKLIGHNALVTPGDASAAFVVRQDLIESGAYRAPSDLKGATIAINVPKTTSQLYVERVLGKGGLSLNDVTLTQVAFPDMVAALGSKAIDAAWAVEPFVTVSQAQNLARPVMPMAEVYPGAVTMVLMLSPSFAQNQPAAAQGFVTAHLRGQRDYYRAFVKRETSREPVIQSLTRYTQLKDPAVYSRLGFHGVDPNGEINRTTLDEMQDYFVTIGSQERKLDLATIIDTSYVERAVQRLGRLA
jgi:NitT/TauT family transport system substrate-binding protein